MLWDALRDGGVVSGNNECPISLNLYDSFSGAGGAGGGGGGGELRSLL